MTNLYGVNLTPVGLFSTIILKRYLEHTGGKEGLILYRLRDLKSQTQVITWKKKRRERKGKET